MEITSEIIYKKLIEIEEKLNQVINAQKLIRKDERFIRKAETNKLFRFPDVMNWSKYVWQDCPYKYEEQREVDIQYKCNLTGKNCEFEGCPENKIKVDK